MRRPLVALSFALSAGLGVVPTAGALAANPSATNTSSTHSGTLSTDSTYGRRANNVSGAQIVQFAQKYIGYPYAAVGDSPSTGFSCIGFVYFVYRSLGIPLPGSLDTALAYAPQVPFSQLEPGDILFFQNTLWTGLSHAAIYIGGGKFIHAEYFGYGVRISSFNNDSRDGNYWITKYMTANRPWGGPALAPIIGSPSTGASAATSPSATAQKQVLGGPQALVTAPSLNVRSGPSMSHGVETVVPQGTNLTILGKRHGWYRVQLPDGTIGWVVAAGIGLGTPSTSVQGQVAATTVGQQTAPARQGYGAGSQSVHASTALVRVSSLRVHSSPAAGAPVVTWAVRGETLQVLARGNGWLEVRTPDGSVGWVMAGYTSAAHARATAAPVAQQVRAPNVHRPTVSATVSGLRVHTAPSIGAAVVTTVGPGEKLQILARSGSWLEVRSPSGQVGWVAAGYTTGGRAPAVSSAKRAGSQHRSASFTGGSVVTVGARVHAAPSLRARVIGGVAAGTHVQILGRSGAWALVRLPSGQTGYVYAALVR